MPGFLHEKKTAEERWPCRIRATVTDENGEKTSFDTVIDTDHDIEGAIEAFLDKRKDGYKYCGKKIIFVTPLGQRGSYIPKPGKGRRSESERMLRGRHARII